MNRVEAMARGGERLLALSDRESDAMQTEIVHGLIRHGFAPTKGNMLFSVGAPTDEEWATAVARMRSYLAESVPILRQS